jgi:hypothetical protein
VRPWLGCATMIVCWMLAGVTPAPAGYWNYGCNGSVGETAYTFDRDSFVIMPKALAKGDIAGLVKGQIFTFDAEDHSGFMATMKFARGAVPDHQIILTEKSSKKISEQKKAASAPATPLRRISKRPTTTSGSAGRVRARAPPRPTSPWTASNTRARRRKLLGADQRLRREYRLHHEATGARVHHTDGPQRQQRHGLHRVAQFGGILQIVRRQWPDQRFMQRA